MLKLRRLRIRGFKALQRLDLHFPGKILILVGGNGSGKSSTLQATAFAQYLIKGQPEQFFTDRGWLPSDVRNKGENNRGHIGLNFHLTSENGHSIAWGLTWSTNLKELESESVWLRRAPETAPFEILKYSRTGRSLLIEGKEFKGIKPPGSSLAILDGSIASADVGDVLSSIQAWATGIFSLELLNPAAMRRGNRGAKTDIGPRGERLGGFLASLPAAQKIRLMKRLSAFYPIEDVETTRKKAGWIDLKIKERYSDVGKISAVHMSDGFMRLLGIAAIPEFNAASMVLLDEIEDGIEPHILSDFIQLISDEAPSQLLMTSHSPVLVNRFKPEQICFMARSIKGEAIAAGFHEIEDMKEGLEFFGAGELWSQTSAEHITKMVRSAALVKEKKLGKEANFAVAERVQKFMAE